MADSLWAELAARAGGELAGAPAPRHSCCARAEAVALIQFSGGAQDPSAGTPRVACTGPASAHRLVARLSQMERVPRVEVTTRNASLTLGRRDHFGLLASLGLRAPGGSQLRGLPLLVIHGGRCDQAATWRGALLAAAPWTRRRTRILLPCPGPELGLALVGAARQLGVTVSYRADTPPIPNHGAASASSGAAPAADGPAAAGSAGSGWVLASWSAFAALLGHAGAPATAALLGATPPAPLRSTGNGQLGASNRARAVTAAARLVTQVRDDLAALDAHSQPVPPALAAIAQLRLAHPRATLPELAALTDPPTTKDAVAGKLRRLHLLATDLSG